jgi:hypothetical protein
MALYWFCAGTLMSPALHGVRLSGCQTLVVVFRYVCPATILWCHRKKNVHELYMSQVQKMAAF